jgi:hypothetical protein
MMLSSATAARAAAGERIGSGEGSNDVIFLIAFFCFVGLNFGALKENVPKHRKAKSNEMPPDIFP